MKKIVLINCYFGRYPNYFNLFIESCKNNSTVDFLLFTDNELEQMPSNVHVVNISFLEIKAMIQEKFDFLISLDAPYKLCDYKPTYGFVFEDYIKGYDYWGYCDVDMIFGNIRHFLSDEILSSYDKFYKLGHLCIFKNNTINNTLFMEDELVSYKDSFMTKNITVFDEAEGIQKIFDSQNMTTYFSRDYADITTKNYRFTLSDLFYDEKMSAPNNYKNQIFAYINGRIFRYYYEGDKPIEKDEFMYIHLQKREFREAKDVGSEYLITNQGFINCSSSNINKDVILKYNNYIFFKELKMKLQRIKYKFKRKISKKRVRINESIAFAVNR